MMTLGEGSAEKSLSATFKDFCNNSHRGRGSLVVRASDLDNLSSRVRVTWLARCSPGQGTSPQLPKYEWCVNVVCVCVNAV